MEILAILAVVFFLWKQQPSAGFQTVKNAHNPFAPRPRVPKPPSSPSGPHPPSPMGSSSGGGSLLDAFKGLFDPPQELNVNTGPGLSSLYGLFGATDNTPPDAQGSYTDISALPSDTSTISGILGAPIAAPALGSPDVAPQTADYSGIYSTIGDTSAPGPGQVQQDAGNTQTSDPVFDPSIDLSGNTLDPNNVFDGYDGYGGDPYADTLA